MDELDAEPTLDELNKAIDSLSTGKAPGSDAIPPDLLKHCKTVLLLPLHELLCQCWKEGAVPQDMRDSKIVTLYKSKGERSDCNNYRGISLLSVVGKVYAKVVLARLQRLAERVYPESQCGFRANRSTIDMIFSLRQLQEKCREQNMPLYIAFIDLTKAFDMVSRDGLFKILPKIGCPPKLQSLIESFHTNMKGTVLYSGNLSEPFDIRGGVKQGCVLAPTLFGIFFALLLKQAFGTATEGIYLRTRSDGRLFNLNRLKAKTKVREALIRDLLFADDAGLAAHTEQGLQSLMDRFSRACNDFGLIISLKKTEVLGQDVEAPLAITIGDHELKAVNHFTYLGSTASNNLSLDKEIDKRIGKAATTLARLTTRVWENPKLSVKTKMAMYNACVLSTLLYGSETWSTYAKQENRLNAFHMRCMRRILGISWKDKVTNTEVLSRAGLPTMFTLLRQRRLRWLGHVRRMEDGRIPKDLLYGELISGKRRTGRPQLRFKDVCKRDLKALDIDTEHWEDLASDRSRWRCTLFRQLKSGELLYSKSFQSVGNRFLESSIFKTVNNIKETECKVLGLIPDSHYRFYVRATTEWGLSQRSTGVLLRTLKKVPPPSFYRQLVGLSVSEKETARFSCELSRPVPIKWLKNDKPLPEDPRFKIEVDRRRHILTISDIKADDAGEYTCDTGSTRSSGSLKVKAEPVTFIKPLKDVEVVRHGKATLECEVSRDDAKVRWLKSGMDVQQNTKHDLKQNGRLHQLIISDVRLDDAAEYVCEIVQKNGPPTAVRSSAKLKIRALNHSVPGTPEIIADESTVTPNSVTLVWKDPDPSNGDVYHVLYAKFYGQSSGRYKTISGVKERLCTVSNLEPDTKYKFYVRAVDKAGISRGVVIATSPPDDGGIQFQKILRDEEVFSKETATFECQLSAPNAEVKWLRNSVPIHCSGKYKIEEEGMTHRLIVNNCGKEDVAEFTCQCGINKTTASLRVKESQGPEILSDKCKIESDSITLYWTTPTLSTFRTYQVLYATSFGPNVTDNYNYQTLSDIHTTFCRIPALAADTTYKFYVRGVTKDGISRPSRGVELTTKPEGRRSRMRTRARSEENLSRALSPSAQKKRLSFNFKDFISDSAPGLTRKEPGVNMGDVLRNYVSPFFKKGLVSTMVKIGSEVRFECSIGGYPNPMVTWEKDGREVRQDYRHKLIRESEEEFTLVIFRVRAEDSGNYEVVATNEAGERRSSATLGVTELESVNEAGSSPVPPPRRRGRISAPIFGDVREKVGHFERGAKRYESFRERRQPAPPEVTESNLRRSQSTEMLSHHQRSKVSAPLSWLKKQLRSSLADDDLKEDKEERESKPSKARSFFGHLRKTHSTSRF
ncbi:OBSCN [Branchiostoma lanceolatum]|uniref:OBSCN protein n=1 Tax=Branchiostoma lanceolatum TaxID=7740 RepID=A0A8J9ZCN9_BRALA|nr:OBSCN [Branchiostoma lanceolatum]